MDSILVGKVFHVVACIVHVPLTVFSFLPIASVIYDKKVKNFHGFMK